MKQMELHGRTTSDLLEKAWVEGTECDDCPERHTWEEHHPYGETTAVETLSECRAEKAEDCPWIERKLREQAPDDDE